MYSSTSYSSIAIYVITFIFLFMPKGSLGTTFTLLNRCDYTVWPGILPNHGSPGLDTTGFELPPRAARSLQAPPGWSGRLWARTGCSFDPTTGAGRCATADCGSNRVECGSNGAVPPATLAEFTVGSGSAALDFYDVSLVDGYNLPMVVQPVGGSGNCSLTGCAADLNRICPNELRSEDGQGCRSACEAFGKPEYCCRGAYGSPDTCRPSAYSAVFKSACPRSYSYAYDDGTSTFTCGAADYTITFCPLLTSRKSSSPATEGGSGSAPPQDDLPSWMPSFGLGGSSSSFVFDYANYFIICASTIFLLL
ncbi:hypothetical protein ABFS82_03G071100 [Erythranthe guttata]|uniref:Thaumatin-like protein 1 n=1 Tax=Erythranthe guttata TaxID=4155 RepID=A0A022RIS2_ERYGU|nr:PREDICTED: pathogenesis-related protein 5 [Erythranthe guttata]EYU38795.1 hypothetical protein MIMGU_mgv1a010603mg [Erythranthe guttata]|eukprot:XP_012835717.1 PREDICTED: pathogenesis-related protein 5 [Erythranthe guttata]